MIESLWKEKLDRDVKLQMMNAMEKSNDYSLKFKYQWLQRNAIIDYGQWEYEGKY